MKRWTRRRFVSGAGTFLAASGAIVAGQQQTHDRISNEDDVLLRREFEEAPAREGEPFRPLRPGDRVDVGGDPQALIEKACWLGHKLEAEHGGCARCTVAALQGGLPFIPEDVDLFRAATCLDGGATPRGIQNCGAFTGAGMIIGYMCGTEPFKSPRLARKLIRKVCAHFESEYGTVLCTDVKAGCGGDCAKVVGLAARWTAEALLDEFGDEKPGKRDAQS